MGRQKKRKEIEPLCVHPGGLILLFYSSRSYFVSFKTFFAFSQKNFFSSLSSELDIRLREPIEIKVGCHVQSLSWHYCSTLQYFRTKSFLVLFLIRSSYFVVYLVVAILNYSCLVCHGFESHLVLVVTK